jgi:hypothetical protein
LPDLGHLDELDTSETDRAALEALQALTDEVRPLVMTPPEERYPPVNPQPDDPIWTQQDANQRQTPRNRSAGRTRQRVAAKPAARLYNRISLFALLGSVLLIAYFAALWQNPLSALNLLPPPTPFVFITATPAPAPTLPAGVPTPFSSSPFAFSATGVTHQANSNGLGCNWASVAGQVTDFNGNGIAGLRVRVTAGADDTPGQPQTQIPDDQTQISDDQTQISSQSQTQTLNETTFTGAARTFGTGGFELQLADAPQAATISVQLFSTQGDALSEPYTIETFASCERNVALIEFRQNRPL